MNLQEALYLPYIGNNLGNATVFIKLIEKYPNLISIYTTDDFIKAEQIYINGRNGIAWLHDIHKNKHLYNLEKTYDTVIQLLNY